MSENPYSSPHEADNFSEVLSRKKKPRVWVVVLAVLGVGALLVALLIPAPRTAREAARRMQCQNNLKQIALALHNYEAAYQALPPAYTVDADGRRLHSWRTLILPYLEQKSLYDTIDLSKPWNDPANAAAYNTIVSVYHCPSAGAESNQTGYLAVVAPGGCFPLAESRTFAEITDGTSQTLMVLEVPAERAGAWMSPQDADEQWVLGWEGDSSTAHPGGGNAAFADGSVGFLRGELSTAQRRAIISVAGDDRFTLDAE